MDTTAGIDSRAIIEFIVPKPAGLHDVGSFKSTTFALSGFLCLDKPGLGPVDSW